MSTRGRLVVFLLGGVALIVAVLFGRAAFLSRDYPAVATGHSLRILAYSTFVGSTGPGRYLIADFKKTCQCDVEISTAGDAGILLERLRLARHANPFDLVIGFDQLTLAAAEKEFGWRTVDLANVPWADAVRSSVTAGLVPFDWSPMTFIYREGEIEPPHSLDDLTSPNFRGKIALQDPRSSTPGLQFLNWVIGQKGAGAENYLEKLKPAIESISPSWSFSYGLFRKGQAQLVFSYLTSLAYHWEVESDRHYRAAIFSDGHPYQIEFAGIPDFCHDCDLAERFLKAMLAPAGQEEIYHRNFMLPAIAGIKMSQSFQDLPTLKLIEVPKEKDLRVWRNVFRK